LKKIDIKPIPGTEGYISLDLNGTHTRRVAEKKSLVTRIRNFFSPEIVEKVIIYQKYITVVVHGRTYALLPPENATEDQIYQVAKDLIDNAEDKERFLIIQEDWKLEAL